MLDVWTVYNLEECGVMEAGWGHEGIFWSTSSILLYDLVCLGPGVFTLS